MPVARNRWSGIVAGVVLVGAACSSSPAATPAASPSTSPSSGTADIGGYSLAYECAGSGSPTVILEAGYTASGIDTYGQTVLPQLATATRVCTYDRAGDGSSDPRPDTVRPLTGATQARELHQLLGAIDVGGPYVLVGHSYGGMVSREFAALYPTEVVGMVLVDASSEPEIPLYDRLHAGAWDDGTVSPAPNQRIDIHATVKGLLHAPPLGAMPLVVITAGIQEDQWLVTDLPLEARAQTRLAGLSSNSVHVLLGGVGHMIPTDDAAALIAAVVPTVIAARSGGALPGCAQMFAGESGAKCLAPGELGHQVKA